MILFQRKEGVISFNMLKNRHVLMANFIYGETCKIETLQQVAFAINCEQIEIYLKRFEKLI